MSDMLALLARVLLSAVFLVSGYFKVMNVNGILNSAGTKHFMEMVAGGAPAPTWLGYLIAAIELLGGLAFLVGFQTRLAAWGLFIWVVVATYLGHPFWTMTDAAAWTANLNNFLKNLAIMGGMLLLVNAGAGAASVDDKRSA